MKKITYILLMVKMYQNSRVFVSSTTQTLSINSDPLYFVIGLVTTRLTCTGTQSKLRFTQQGLSKPNWVFERGLRKSSSLTNGIGSAHYKTSDTSTTQESMAKKARGLNVSNHVSHVVNVAMSASAEEPSMVQRRRN